MRSLTHENIHTSSLPPKQFCNDERAKLRLLIRKQTPVEHTNYISQLKPTMRLLSTDCQTMGTKSH